MLSNKALLVHLVISQKTFRKLDKRATSSVASTFNTDSKAGNYTKKLLPGAKELDTIGALAQSIRQFVYSQTLPWLADGTRILSAKNYIEFTAEFRTRKQTFDRAVASFVTAYPQLREHARNQLGELFNDFEYPTAASLAESFGCDISFMPLPDVSDFRIDISDVERAEFESKMRDVESKAVRDCWERLHEVCAKAASKLSHPEAIFRDSLIENISDLCKLLPRLNVTDDPALESARQDVERLVSGLSADVCRDNATERDAAARRLKEMSEAMSAFMGSSTGVAA